MTAQATIGTIPAPDVPDVPPGRGTLWRDVLVALLIGVVLVGSRAIGDWARIGHLNLPDTDDMMRLAQVRDWLAGQAFNDWTQYRVAPPFGSPMHWSRINDFGIAGLILLFAPLVGRHVAEQVAVVAYPGTLFVIYLFLAARIARRLGGGESAIPAIVLAAISYPAIGLFLPGRIDHHALQIVLTLVTVLALMRRATAANGIVGGVAVALSLGIGLETVPQVAAAMAALFVFWLVRGADERARMIGFGLGLAGVTALLLAVARPTLWSAQWCDAFTPASSTAALVGGGYWVLIALIPLRDWRVRSAVGGVLGGIALAAVVAAYPVCLTGPYGPMDPFVRHALVDNITEAKGLLSARTPGWGLPFAGELLLATVVAVMLGLRRPGWRMALLPSGLVLLASAIVVLFQARGAYVGSALAGPVLAQLIVAARRLERGRLIALPGAWLISSGLVWALVPVMIDDDLHPATAKAALPEGACNSPDVWTRIDRYPAGVFMTPANEAAYVIGGTRHGSVGASYHRNNRGNRAMYDFFLSDPDKARAIAARWRVDYVLICPTDFAELDVRHVYPRSLATRLTAGAAPPWLRRLPLGGTSLALYRVVP